LPFLGGERVRPPATTPKSGVIPRQILKNLIVEKVISKRWGYNEKLQSSSLTYF
jgi:hypothetical protein